MPRRPGDVGLYLMMAMGSDSLEELDVVAGLQGHDGLLPARAMTGEAADPLLLATHHQGADAGDRHLEQRLHGVADLDLVGVLGHLEHDLLGVVLALGRGLGSAAGLTQARALLGEQRTLDDGLGSSHDVPRTLASRPQGRSASSTCLAAAEVSTTASWRRMS